MTPRKQVERAIRRITKGWRQEYFARTAKGEDVVGGSRAAVAWCLVGAFQTPDTHWMEIDVEDAVMGCVKEEHGEKFYSPVQFNDAKGRTKKEVLAVLRCARDKFPIRRPRRALPALQLVGERRGDRGPRSGLSAFAL